MMSTSRGVSRRVCLVIGGYRGQDRTRETGGVKTRETSRRNKGADE